MLGKIMKYEFKSTMRILLPLQLVILLLSVLARLAYKPVISNSSSNEVYSAAPNLFSGVITLTYFLSLVVANAFTVIYLFACYYRTMFKDQGYLTHTLPVKTMTVFWGKFLSNISWVIICGLVSVLSFVIFSYNDDFRQAISYLPEVLTDMADYTEMSVSAIIIYFIALFIFEIMEGLLSIYLCMSVAQLFSKHHILAAAGTFVVIYIFEQTITSLLLMGAGFWSYIFSPDYDSGKLLSSIMLPLLLVEILYVLIYYFLNRYIIKNKLNLE